MKNTNLKSALLLVQVFIVSACSLTYELLLGTAYANITSNSVLAYSISIGLFLAGLGTGAFISRWVKNHNLADAFIWTETVLAIFGGLGVLCMYLGLTFTTQFWLIQISLTVIIGLLSGLEIPILARILNQENNFNLSNVLANVLSFDYLGGLAASVLFPIVLLPYFGLMRLNFLTGLINILMAILGAYIFWPYLKTKLVHSVSIFLVFGVLISGYIWSEPIYSFVESRLYRDTIIYSTQTPFQRIVLTQKGTDTSLYLNGGIQFSSTDEYRYHESLVMPVMAMALQKNLKNLNIAVFGGGDGLAVRELLKFNTNIAKISLVDIDPAITNLGSKSQLLTTLNQNSLINPKVQIINTDAWEWLQKQPEESLDIIIADLPDPDETAIAKLYSNEFYKIMKMKMSPHGLFVTQSSSILNSAKVFWSIHKTLENPFQNIKPYQAFVPSFGLWGFQIASKEELINSEELTLPDDILNKNRFIDKNSLLNIFVLTPDILNPKLNSGVILDKSELKINSLDNLILTKYYQESSEK